VEDQEVIAQELSGLGEKVRELAKRIAEVEKVNARLEDAALITARALQEIAGHWDAVYEAMRRREEDIDLEEELGKAPLLRRFRGGAQPQADPLPP
jgi:cell fate (sporulation/competence/biofilm development) regulator YmcA (YheA/YmcA/DUF963 family)